MCESRTELIKKQQNAVQKRRGTEAMQSAIQFSLFMHPDQAQNTSSGIQGQEATAVAVIYVTAPTSSRKTTKYK